MRSCGPRRPSRASTSSAGSASPSAGWAIRTGRRSSSRARATPASSATRFSATPSDCEAVWDAAWAAGEPHGLSPLGLEALDILRIEAGLIFSGYEFDDQTDPFEAGIGFTVPLKSKDDDFCGKAALVKRKANPQRALVGLELTGNEVASHGDGVFVGRHRVGVVTSGTRSPLSGKSIALCRMAVEHAALGTAVEVGQLDGVQKRLEAAVVPFPFYDPEKKRVRM